MDKYPKRNYRNLFLVNQDEFWDKWNYIFKNRNQSKQNENINDVSMILIKKITTLLWNKFDFMKIYNYSEELNSIINTQDAFKIYDSYVNIIISQLFDKKYKFVQLNEDDIIELSTDIFYLLLLFLRFRFIELRYKQLVEFQGNDMTLRLEYMSPSQCKEFIKSNIIELKVL